MVNLSVVIPVYNTVDYLDQCLQSVLEQTGVDMQVILVDDGSTDGSADLCDRWSQKDNRVQVIHQKNAGPTAACLAGVRQARAKWVAMPDSDDELAAPGIYAAMMEEMLRFDAQSVQCSFQAVGWGQDAPAGRQGKGIARVQNAHDRIEELLYPPAEVLQEQGVWDPSRATKIFHREYLQAALEQVPAGMRYGEDYITQIYFLSRCDRVVLMNDLVGYHYIRRQGSLSNIPALEEETTKRLEVQHACADLLQKLVPGFDAHHFFLNRRWELFRNILVARSGSSLGTYSRSARRICTPGYRQELWQRWVQDNPAPSAVGKLGWHLIVYGNPLLGAVLLRGVAGLKKGLKR